MLIYHPKKMGIITQKAIILQINGSKYQIILSSIFSPACPLLLYTLFCVCSAQEQDEWQGRTRSFDRYRQLKHWVVRQ